MSLLLFKIRYDFLVENLIYSRNLNLFFVLCALFFELKFSLVKSTFNPFEFKLRTIIMIVSIKTK